MSKETGSEAIQYRLAQTTEIGEMAALKSKVYHGAPQDAWTRRWAWQFAQHPWRNPEHPSCFLVAVLDGRIIGGLGWIPTRLLFGGQVTEAAFGCDLFLDPDAQGHGLGKKLIDRVVALHPVSFWMNLDPAGAQHYERRGFTPVSPVDFHALLVHPGSVLRMMGRPGWARAASWADPAARAAATLWTRSVRPPRGVSISGSAPATGLTESMPMEMPAPDTAGLLRDDAYLGWRYRDTPLGPYRFRTARHGSEVVGLVVYRARASKGEIVGIIAELRASPVFPAARAALLAAASGDLIAEGASAVRIFATDPTTRGACRRLGMIDTRRTPYMYVSPGSAQRLALPSDAGRWSLAYGDCDLDIV